MEVLSLISFIIGVALVSGQCNQSNIEQCLNQTDGAFGSVTNNNGIQDIAKLCSETTITAFACFKNEMNKCSSSLSFTVKEELSLLNRITVEGLRKVCKILSNLKQGSIECFNRAIQNSLSSIQACMKSDSTFADANLPPSTILCKTFDVTYKCGLEHVRNDCSTQFDDFGSLSDAMHTLFACDDSGNGFSRCKSAPAFLLTVFGVIVVLTVGW